MKLTEGWGEPKNDSKGEDGGFKMEEGGGEGKNMPAHSHCSLMNPFTGWTGALIDVVGCILIATCQSKRHISPSPPWEEFTLIHSLSLPLSSPLSHPSSTSPFFNCFQSGGLSDRILNENFKTPALHASCNAARDNNFFNI